MGTVDVPIIFTHIDRPLVSAMVRPAFYVASVSNEVDEPAFNR